MDTDRRKAYEERMRYQGMSKLTIWVPDRVLADLRIMMELLRDDPDLELSHLRSSSTGRYRSIHN